MRATSTRERDGILVGAGAGLTLIVLLILQSFIGSGFLSARTVTSTTTTLSTPTEEFNQVASAYADHLLQLDSDNISGLVSGYERNATVEWTGLVAGLVGNYSGSGDIEILFGSSFGKTVNFSVSNESQTVAPRGIYCVVNSTFNFSGNNQIEGNINASIAAQDAYVHVGNTWLIANETWNYLSFYDQFQNFGP
jgi:hypothetical protein